MHVPVLLKEVISILNPQPGENFIDATINGGGFAFEILKHTAPDGKVLGIDLDEALLEETKKKAAEIGVGNRLILQHGNFADLKKIVQKFKFQGIVFDLGMSSWQLENSGRGFSFQKDEFLDMRFSKEFPVGAYEVLRSFSEKDLADIFWRYGNERASRQIAKEIVLTRRKKPLQTTKELADLISQRRRHSRLHPATKVFQALRIFVNHELENIETVLPQTIEVLPSGGRVALISFHELEDKIVKTFIKMENAKGTVRPLIKKPIIPSFDEQKVNPRSRSAKLRAYETF